MVINIKSGQRLYVWNTHINFFYRLTRNRACNRTMTKDYKRQVTEKGIQKVNKHEKMFKITSNKKGKIKDTAQRDHFTSTNYIISTSQELRSLKII